MLQREKSVEMKKIKGLAGGACVALCAVAFMSCARDNAFVGEWKATAPVDMAPRVPGAAAATVQPVITFADGGDRSGGNVTITGDIDVLRDVMPTGQDGTVRVSGKGSFTVSGHWSYDVDDHDDLLLDLDYGSLAVRFDKAGIELSGPGAVAMKDDMRDAFAATEAVSMSQEIKVVLGSELARYSVIKDVEVGKDRTTLSFEIESPEQDLRFRAVN